MELRLEGFKGIKRSSARREQDIPDPSYLREAKNVVIANDGSIHCRTGNTDRTPGSTGTIHRVFYSRALGRYVTVNATNGDIKVHAIDSNGAWSLQTTHATYLPEGTDTDMGFGTQGVDWPITSVFYMISGGAGGGSSMVKLSAAGVTAGTVTLASSSIYPPQCICVHKDTLWLSKGNKLFPSDDLTPETIDAANALTIGQGTTYISGLYSMGGILYAHQKDNITAVIGDTFVGTAADVSLISLDTGVGTMRPSGGCVYKGLQWFQGPGGYYVFNGEKVKPLGDRLCLQFNRKLSPYV